MDTHKHTDAQGLNYIQKFPPPVKTPAPIYLFSPLLSLNIVTHFLISSALLTCYVLETVELVEKHKNGIKTRFESIYMFYADIF